jgi:signal transduction histidine kinase
VGAELDRRFPQLAALHGAPGWAGALGEAAVAAAEGDEQGFLLAVEREVSRALRRRPDAAPWFDAVQAALALAGAGRAAPGAASLAAAALALVGALAATAQSALRIQARSEAQILRRVILPDLLGEASFFDVLRAELPRLGIRSFHLSRFVDGDRAQVACHYDLSGAIELTDPAAPFPSRRLVPGRFAPGRRHVHVVLPVFARSERLGFALCEAGETDPSAYETLTNQISTMVKLNSLLEEVRGQQRQLLDSAHQAGMAEVASGVLHGVGNLLNSVRVSAGEIEALAGGRHVEGLTRANELLAAHRADLASFFATDPRAPLVPEYYARVVEALAAERRRLRAEARDLREAIDLVRDSIRSLQSHTQDPGDALLAEPLDLGDLVDWVLRLEEGELARERVRVLREVPALPALHLPRAKLVHVLVALLRNAVSAMRETPPPARQLTIRAAAERGGVRLEIADTGRGIAPEDLGRIFTFGFATPSGGRGFGLHTAANTVGQLGGTLTADSAGAGRGATFTLVLPATVTS